MTIPDTAPYQGLKHFHDPRNLAFRAACNGAAPVISQPIKTRIIKRIYESEDAQQILVRLWDEMLASAGAVPHHQLANALVSDLCWKTLVLEEVTAVRCM